MVLEQRPRSLKSSTPQFGPGEKENINHMTFLWLALHKKKNHHELFAYYQLQKEIRIENQHLAVKSRL